MASGKPAFPQRPRLRIVSVTEGVMPYLKKRRQNSSNYRPYLEFIELHVFFTGKRKYLERNGIVLTRSPFSSCVKRLQCADRPICLVRLKDRPNDGIDVGVEKGPIHSTGDTLPLDIAENRIRHNTGIVQEPLQVT
jgi:hypothetical protein